MTKFQYTAVKVGADPELFLYDRKVKTFFSAVGLIGGTKDQPVPIDDEGHSLQEDNVAVEFCIPPASSEKAFVDSIHYVLDHLKEKVEPRFELSIVPSAAFKSSQLQTKQAHLVSCRPDYNAWTLAINEFKRSKKNTNLRTAGGHIHVGYANPDEDNQVNMIRAMDLFIGVPSVILDSDTKRRELYGKAGAFRPKPYGVEFRTPSNFWIKTRELTSWAYQNTHKAVKFLNEGNTIEGDLGQRIQETINQIDLDGARAICKEFELLPASA